MTEFEAIYKEYFRDVYLYILGISHDEHTAEEVTQETFFRAMKAVKDFRGDCDIRVWLCQIAKNEYYSYLRKHKKLEFTNFAGSPEAVADIGGKPVDRGVTGKADFRADEKTKDIEQQLLDTETAVRIHKLLHAMQEPYKEVFGLRVFGELSFEQIGDIFGRNANWACVTYHRAKAKIQKEMEDG